MRHGTSTSGSRRRPRPHGSKRSWARPFHPGFWLLPAAAGYFGFLIHVETQLSVMSRRTEDLQTTRDSLRIEVAVAGASLSEKLCLESLLTVARDAGLERAVPDQVAHIVRESPHESNPPWAAIVRPLLWGFANREAGAQGSAVSVDPLRSAAAPAVEEGP